MFIVLEGGDNAGKTTLAKNFCLVLNSLLEDEKYVYLTHEPYKEYPQIERIYSLLEDIEYKHYAPYEWFKDMNALLSDARLYHSENFIKPLLKEGAYVVSDRYILSNMVYQTVLFKQTKTEIDEFSLMADIGLQNINAIQPDICFFLDTPIEERKKRIDLILDNSEDLDTDWDTQRLINEKYREIYKSSMAGTLGYLGKYIKYPLHRLYGGHNIDALVSEMLREVL